jgi:regulator of replication initiation timing
MSTQLSHIIRDTQKLIQLCNQLQKENDILKLEVQSLQVAMDTSLQQNRQMDEQLKALTVARSLDTSPGDDAIINEKILDTKRKINDFVREIDKCIELLK